MHLLRPWFPCLCLLVMLCPAVRAVVERTLEREYPVKPGVRVRAHTFSGSIAVIPRADLQTARIKVRQSLDVIDEAAADARLAQLQIDLSQASDGSVHLAIAPRHRLRWTWENWSPATLSVELEVPASVELDLRAEDGAVTVGSLKGAVRAELGSGMLFMGEIDGPVSAENHRGDIALTACSSALKLRTRNGSILIGRSSGKADLTAVDGVIDVQQTRGPVQARGDRADIKIGLGFPLLSALDLKTDGGDITVSLDPRSPASIKAQASRFGQVGLRDLEPRTTHGEIGSSRWSGMLQGGGPLLRLRASGGNIRINAVPAGS